jgi:hypothetical protein
MDELSSSLEELSSDLRLLRVLLVGVVNDE